MDSRKLLQKKRRRKGEEDGGVGEGQDRLNPDVVIESVTLQCTLCMGKENLQNYIYAIDTLLKCTARAYTELQLLKTKLIGREVSI